MDIVRDGGGMWWLVTGGGDGFRGGDGGVGVDGAGGDGGVGDRVWMLL